MKITNETSQALHEAIQVYFDNCHNVKCISIVNNTTFTVEYYTGTHLETKKYMLTLDAELDILFLYNIKKVSFVNKGTLIHTEVIGECINYFNVNSVGIIKNIQYRISPCKAEHVFKEVTTEI